MSNPNKSIVTLSYRIQGADEWKAKILRKQKRMSTEYVTMPLKEAENTAESLE